MLIFIHLIFNLQVYWFIFLFSQPSVINSLILLFCLSTSYFTFFVFVKQKGVFKETWLYARGQSEIARATEITSTALLSEKKS